MLHHAATSRPLASGWQEPQKAPPAAMVCGLPRDAAPIGGQIPGALGMTPGANRPAPVWKVQSMRSSKGLCWEGKEGVLLPSKFNAELQIRSVSIRSNRSFSKMPRDPCSLLLRGDAADHSARTTKVSPCGRPNISTVPRQVAKLCYKAVSQTDAYAGSVKTKGSGQWSLEQREAAPRL